MKKQILTALFVLFCGLSYAQKKELVNICIGEQWGVVSPVEYIHGGITIKSNGKAIYEETTNTYDIIYVEYINKLSRISFCNGYEVSRAQAMSSNITRHNATISSGVVGLDASVPVGIEYVEKSGDSYDYDNVQKVTTTSNGQFSVTLSDLKSNTRYMCRPFCIVDGSTYYGTRTVFTTKPPIETGYCLETKEYSATITGKVYDVESNVTVGIIYGTTNTLSATSGTMKSTTSKGNFTLTLSGLKPYTTYYYCAFALIDGTYYYGDTKSFTTMKDYYEIGDVYPRNGTPEGIVFSVSNGGKSGKIVSLDYTRTQWDDESLFGTYYGNTNSVNGATNTGPTKSGFAYSWCVAHGSGWYLPARNELKILGANLDKVNEGIKKFTTLTIPRLLYWSSTEYSANHAYVVMVGDFNGYASGYTTYHSKTENNMVVAVKAF